MHKVRKYDAVHDMVGPYRQKCIHQCQHPYQGLFACRLTITIMSCGVEAVWVPRDAIPSVQTCIKKAKLWKFGQGSIHRQDWVPLASYCFRSCSFSPSMQSKHWLFCREVIDTYDQSIVRYADYSAGLQPIVSCIKCLATAECLAEGLPETDYNDWRMVLELIFSCLRDLMFRMVLELQ